MSKEQGNRPTIFLVEEDDDTRPVLKRNIQDYGYRVLLSLDEEDALERVGEGSVRADLILINLVGVLPEEALSAGRRIRQQAELDVPVVVLAEKFGKDVEGTNEQVEGHDWITYLEDPDQLRNLLSRLTSKDGDEGQA